MKILIKSFVDYFRDDGPMFAGAISCFFLMAMIPFLILLISIFGYVLGHENQFYHFFMSQVVSLFPRVTHQITRQLESIVRYREIGVLTLAVYALFSYQLYVSIETALHHIFRVKEKRPFLFSVLLSFLTITLLAIFLLFSFGATWAISSLEFLREFFPQLKVGVATRFFSRFILPALLLFLFTAALYLVLPRKKIRIRHALWGGMFTAIFLEIAKHIFTFYMSIKISRLGAIYGSLTAIITFLMWLFYSSSIFLVGAELVRHLGNPKGR